MVRSRSAFGCTTRDTRENRRKGIFFYRIPLEKEKRRLWLNAMRRKNFDPPENAAICSQHFIGGNTRTHTHTRQEVMIVLVFVLHTHWTHLQGPFIESSFFPISGKKSSDPESPAYVPSIFKFTSSPKRRKADLSMTQYEAAKRRRKCKDKQETVKDLLSENEQFQSVAVQTGILSHSV